MKLYPQPTPHALITLLFTAFYLVCLDTLQPLLRALVLDDDERTPELVEREGWSLAHVSPSSRESATW